MVPVIAASFVFSTVVKSLVDKSFPTTLSIFVANASVRSVEFTFKSKAACVLVLIGFNKSLVLSTLESPMLTLSIAKAVFNDPKLVTPVPPFDIGTIPKILSASTLLAN